MSTFPELSVDEHAKLIRLDEEWLKSQDGKKRWRDFMNTFVLSISFGPSTEPRV
jgi:replication fork protection complex subunit Tof1/Swi1